MSGGAHSRWHARQSAHADLVAAITAAASGELTVTCRCCGYLHGPDMIPEQVRLSHVLLTDVTDHRLTRLQRRKLAVALGMALLAEP